MLTAMHDYTEPARPASDDLVRFVRAQTAIETPPLVPELRLHLASAVTELWHATEQTLAVAGLDPPYWAFAWPGGQAVARHVLDHPALVRGRTVLDFAAGSGVAAIAAARAGAAAVTASELDRFACTAIALNAQINGTAVQVVSDDLTAAPDACWDIILAGDVCYERPMAERVFAWLTAQVQRGTTVLLGDPGRAYLPPGLAEVARHAVPTTREVEGCTERIARVFRLESGSAQDASRSSTIR